MPSLLLRPGLLACALAFPGPASAIRSEDATLCDQAALQAAAQSGVPPQVMLAITRVESGRPESDGKQPWPWTINLAGEGHWFDSLDAALQFAGPEIDAGTTNMDIGCFQLNLRWHAEAFPSLEAMFDPEANARYAADFLTSLRARKGNWVDAVAAYHSQTPEHAERYIEKVEAVLASLDPSESPEAEETPAPMNGFPLLKPGSRGGFGSLVPVSGGLPPLIGQEP